MEQVAAVQQVDDESEIIMARHPHHLEGDSSRTLSPAQRYASFQKANKHRASVAARFAATLPFDLDDFQTEANDALEA
ncbi:hypothetical protein LK487_17700, partial [[Eubacterium] rectale]|nr:hypothetical protein [Agathobacter rectalis]